MTRTVPFMRPTIGEAEEKAVIDCLHSGWLASGPRVASFEKAFAEYIRGRNALAVSSGTAALHLGLLSLGLEPGDEVITPSLTWASVPNLISIIGCRPVYCDINPETLNLDPDDVAERITSRTRAIVPVHFAGRPVERDRIADLAAAHDLYVLEDACHAIGATFANEKIGIGAPLCAFSFHPTKTITTGEGGMLSGTDDRRLEAARRIRYHGVTRDTYSRHTSNAAPHYDIAEPGYKYVMGDMNAALGLCQLARIDDFLDERERLVSSYRDAIAPLADRIWIPPEESRPGARHAWHLFNVCVADEPGLRDEVMHRLSERGIGVGLHYQPVHLTTVAREAGWDRQLPHTERVGRTILSLPLYVGMDQEDIVYVCAELQEALRQAA